MSDTQPYSVLLRKRVTERHAEWTFQDWNWKSEFGIHFGMP